MTNRYVHSTGLYVIWSRQHGAWEVGRNYWPQIGGGDVCGWIKPYLVDRGVMTDGEITLRAEVGPWGFTEIIGEFWSDWKAAADAIWKRTGSF